MKKEKINWNEEEDYNYYSKTDKGIILFLVVIGMFLIAIPYFFYFLVTNSLSKLKGVTEKRK